VEDLFRDEEGKKSNKNIGSKSLHSEVAHAIRQTASRMLNAAYYCHNQKRISITPEGHNLREHNN